MQKINMDGRSMIEMLGVLAIIGVLSIGGYEMVNKAMQQHRDNQLIAQTMSLVAQARKIICDYDIDDRKSAAYLKASEAIPAGLEYNEGKMIGIADSEFSLGYEAKEDTDYGYLTVTVSNVAEESCLKVVSTFWGNDKNSKLEKVVVNKYDLSKNAMGEVLDKCKTAGNTVTLYYRGCFD